MTVNPAECDKMFNKTTISGVAASATAHNDLSNRKFRQLTALHLAGASAMQAMVAYEKVCAESQQRRLNNAARPR